MKVLHFLPDFQVKGPFIVARNIANNTKKCGIESIFLSLRSSNASDDLERNYKCSALKSGRFPSLNTLNKLKEVIKSEKIDIIHCHGFWPTVLCFFLPKGLKKVTTVHNNPFEDYVFEYGKFIGSIMAIIFRISLVSYDRVVSISQFVKKSINIANTNSVVIHNGVDIIEINSKRKENNILNIGIVSALIERKNVKLAIDIVLLLNRNGINAHLSIVGEGAQKNKLEEYVNLRGASEIVNFLGGLDYVKTMDFIGSSDLFLLTSKSEGFGLVLVEAMMLGTVPMAFDIPACREVISFENLLFKDAQDFLEKYLVIKNNITMYSETCRKRYDEKFSSSSMGFKYYELYSTI
ncbi:glycosyltransferase [Vibrio cyclitrophicus]|nr:glycosyltransferase [Vibrio cyclitrophicus]PMJ29683.1 hypothetical protein BCU25_18170 [Vibrio cyclitrophicus]